MRHVFRPALTLFVLMSLLLGAAYPAVVTLAAQVLFPVQSKGSLIEKDGKVLGSRLIGQAFSDPEFFWGRPSATSPFAYNAAASAGSNLGPANPILADNVEKRIEAFKQADPENKLPVPADLVTSSGSGLDPHISPAAAAYQAARIAGARKIGEDKVRELIARYTEGRTFGLLGEERVNVLLLNLALDGKLQESL
ncbi:MAG: potassium-transporting ATPase subunit KdpC [Alphaproteobacteria bacterium]|nr:potassium-transporting ATPase subunit KdpC [Alphaproteobacteria bacterium]